MGISRRAVACVLAQVQTQREGRAAPDPKPHRRVSIIDEYEPILKELLARYSNLTVERAVQELQARGFPGRYTIVRERMKRLRPRAAPPPVPRFETAPGTQAQMDYGVYDIDFVREGRRRVYLFSYLLGYSRRQYLRFVESMDLPTTLGDRLDGRVPGEVESIAFEGSHVALAGIGELEFHLPHVLADEAVDAWYRELDLDGFGADGHGAKRPGDVSLGPHVSLPQSGQRSWSRA